MAGVADAYGARGGRARLPGRRRPAAPARRPARRDRRHGRAPWIAARSRRSGSTARSAGCSRLKRRARACSPGAPCRSTAFRPWSAAPAFQADAATIAARSIVHGQGFGRAWCTACARARPALTLVTYAEEENRTVGTALAAELRAQGFPVTLVRLWPASGAAQLRLRRRRAPPEPDRPSSPTADRPIAGRGTIGLPAALDAPDRAARPARSRRCSSRSATRIVIGGLPEVGSYLIGWRSNAVTERAVARALAGAAPITGRLPIGLPPPLRRAAGACSAAVP